ncbi:MAG: type II secretion system F family protein [Candidatus Nitrosocaldaceae archaeon]
MKIEKKIEYGGVIGIWIIVALVSFLTISNIPYLEISNTYLKMLSDTLSSFINSERVILLFIILTAIASLTIIKSSIMKSKERVSKKNLKRVSRRLRKVLREERRERVEKSIISNYEERLIKKMKKLLDYSLLSKTRITLAESLSKDILTAGMTESPRRISSKSIAYMIISASIMIPLSIYLSTINKAYIALMLTPAVMLLYPSIELKMLINNRKNKISDELPFFISYASIMQSIGRSLVVSLNDIINKHIFEIIEREARLVRRNIEFFGMDPLDVLNEIAINHPNEDFRTVMLGYTSVARSGGDVVNYLEEKSNEFFNNLKFRMEKYKEQAGTLSEMMLIALIVFPTLIISSAFIMAAGFFDTLAPMILIVMPIASIGLIVLADRAQPPMKDEIVHTNYTFVVGGIVAIILFYMIKDGKIDIWLGLAITTILTSLVNLFYVLPQIRSVNSINKELPNLLRDVTEYRKIGYDLTASIIKLSEERTYNKAFTKLLRDITILLKLGYSLEYATSVVKIRSWLAKLIFFNLSKISETGGGSAQILEYMTNFIRQYLTIKNEMYSSIRVFTIIAYVGPFLMVWIMRNVVSIIEKIGPGAKEFYGADILNIAITNEFLGFMNIIVTVAALCLGLVVTKIVNFSMKNTLSIIITILITIISIYIMPYIPLLGA